MTETCFLMKGQRKESFYSLRHHLGLDQKGKVDVRRGMEEQSHDWDELILATFMKKIAMLKSLLLPHLKTISQV